MTDRYADWKAPAQDGDVLLWPTGDRLKQQAVQNQARLSTSETLVQNVPLRDLRQRHREWLGHEDGRPLIATGHQTELFHPGVWIKLAAINAIAGAVDGTPYHFAVDSDEPKHLHLKWPGAFEPITDDPALLDARWAGLVAGPTPAHVTELQQKYEAASQAWAFQSLLGDFLDTLKPLTLEAGGLASTLVNATHQLDWELGLRHHSLLASPMWGSDAFLVMAHHLLARADTVASDYNAALADYRRKNQIRSPGRPMPDLNIAPDSIECPFWIDNLRDGSRVRCKVTREGNVWILTVADGASFTLDRTANGWEAAGALRNFLRQSQYRISPRALTLTLFVRLLVADQFVHGIGGGRYDQVLDTFIERHFKLPAPEFAVATATLYFPTAHTQSRACVKCVQMEGHKLQHGVLGDRKSAYLDQINAMPRKSLQRRQVFNEMQQERHVAVLESPAIKQWEKRLDETRTREASEAILFDRELFYALQPRERLLRLIEACAL